MYCQSQSMNPPLAIDIDGTMSREDRSIEGRIFDALRSWNGTIVVATGKAVPYPIALCDYIGIDILVVAENGGIIVHNDDLIPTYDLSALHKFDKAFRGDGHDYGWPGSDLVNRWRQTEIAASHSVSLDLLKKYASQFDLNVVDSNYAYHISPSGVDKGAGLRAISKRIGLDPMDFVSIGDSENDIPLFLATGNSYAVSNAPPSVQKMANNVTTLPSASGLLEVLSSLTND